LSGRESHRTPARSKQVLRNHLAAAQHGHSHGGTPPCSLRWSIQAASNWSVAGPGGQLFGIAARRVAFENLTTREQWAVARNTSVLVGVHGAGLLHQISMPVGSAVVEYLYAG